MSLADDLRAYEAAHPHPAGLGPSDAGECRRRLSYQERREPQTDEVDMTPAALGTAFDRYLTGEVWPYLYPEDCYQLPVTVPGLRRQGTVDRYSPSRRRVTDLKTTTVRSHERIEREGPWEDNVAQVDIYALALTREGKPVDEVELLYVNRDSGAELSLVFDYDETAAAAALERLLDTDAAIRDGRELPRDRSGPGLDPICDRWCPWKSVCWDLPNVPAGRSPQSHVLTITDADAEEAARLYDEARAAAAAAEKVKAAAHARLAGLAGRFGEYEVAWKPSGTTLDQSAVAALLAAHDLPVPRVPKNPALSVRRVG